MPLPMIASITRTDNGHKAYFLVIDENLDGTTVCVGCKTSLWGRVSPVELVDGGEIDKDSRWDCSPLCRECSYRTGARIMAGPGWSGLGTADIAAMWTAVNTEQAEETERELARYRAAALEEVQAAHAALKPAGSDQGVNGLGKVA